MRTILGTLLLVVLLSGSALGVEYTQILTGEIVHDGGWNYGCAWGDYDGDDDLDLFVINNDEQKDNFLYQNNGDGTFTKIITGSVVTDGGSSYGCTWGDYDNDGDLDLFVANYNENNFLYANEGDGTFSRVVTGAIVTNGGSSTGCSWGDYDNDGWLDLYVCNRTTVNFLYHGNGDGTFTRITSGAIVTDNFNSSACAWGDYDGDGLLDLIVANSGPAANCLYHNNGDGTFAKVTTGPVVTVVSHSDGASWGDYDNDGDLDLFVVSGTVGYSNDYLFENDGAGGFTQVLTGPIVEAFHWAEGSTWGDHDNDGDLDLFVGVYDGPGGNNRLYENQGDGTFISVDTGPHIAAGNYSKGTTWADYDHDGDLDIFIAKNNYFGGDNVLFRNEGTSGHWLQVTCRGTQSNRSGIGARVCLYATLAGEPVAQLRVISAQSGGGTSSQDGLITCFGLGDAAVADSLVVHWPSGMIDRRYDVPAEQRLEIVEGAAQLVLEPDGRAVESVRCRPNPVRDHGSLTFTLAAEERIELAIFDAQGRVISRTAPRVLAPGRQTISWRAADWPTGWYQARLQVNGRPVTRSFLVLH